MQKTQNKQMPLSTVLRTAATLLWAGKGQEPKSAFFGDKGKFKYSCDAVGAACWQLFKLQPNTCVGEARSFLALHGVDNTSLASFDGYGFTQQEIQAVRYAWLMFMADIADEEGEYIEYTIEQE